MNTENYDFLLDVADENSKTAIQKFSENFYKNELSEDELVSNFLLLSFNFFK
jgi:hypothetical protein